MGILKGSWVVNRYTVEGDLPQVDTFEWIQSQLKANSFKDIDENFEELSIGWVSAFDLLDSAFAVCPVAGDYTIFALRIDERKIPATTVKRFCLKEERRIMRERQIPKLSRGQKAEIKGNITLKLVKKATPVSVIHDLYWDFTDNFICLLSSNKSAHEVLENLFPQTFGLPLVRQIPYTLGETLIGTPAMKKITPICFV